MRFDVVSIFPQALGGLLSVGVVGQAWDGGEIAIHFHDLRDFTDDAHRVVDDRPYGGGAGMLLKVEPFVRALEAIRPACGPRTTVLLLSAQGKLFGHEDAVRYARGDGLVLLCGRYEGVDERILAFVDEEISIGDFVLAGGEAAAAVVIEATARMLPGVVGKYESVATDSFYGEARLGAPQYTRPPLFRGLGVPDVLLSGDHARIEEFRAREAWKKTAKNRPLLLGLREKGTDEDG
ncbi:MAG: tRNA (guanosine(37)-N1)-methyltransferase TrmD [bacterium]